MANEVYEIGVVESDTEEPVRLYWVPGLGFETIPVAGGGSTPVEIEWVREAVKSEELQFADKEAEAWFHRWVRASGVLPRISTVPAPGTQKGVTFWFWVAVGSAVLLVVVVWLVIRMMGA